MIPIQTGSARHVMLLAAMLLALPAINAIAQRTGEWTVIDGRHEGRKGTHSLQAAASSRGHYVVLFQEDPSIGPYTIHRTTDGGTSWSVVRADSGTNFMVRDIVHPSNDLILAIGDTTIEQTVSHPWMIRSTDGGATWSRGSFPDGFLLQSISMADARSGAILGHVSFKKGRPDYALFVTSDGGGTWTRRTVAGELNPERVVYRSPGHPALLAYDGAAKSDVMMRSSDDGLTWTSGPLPQGVSAIDFVDSLVGWGAGGVPITTGAQKRDLIVKTTDGGATWSTVIDSIIDNRFGFQAIAFADRDHGIAVGGYAKILRTSDGGSTWRQEWPPSYTVAEYVNFIDVAYPAPDEALTVTGFSSYVMKYTGRQRLAAPVITEPGLNNFELPLDMTIVWTSVDGADVYDFQAGDTTYEYNFVNHRIFDLPYISDTGLTATSRRVQLEPWTRYTFRVRARNGADTSDWSRQVPTITRKAGQTLVIPYLTLPAFGAQAVALPVRFEWTAVPGATGYDLFVGDRPDFLGSNPVALTDYLSTSYVAGNLRPNTTYFALIRSRNATEIGNWSSLNQGILEFTTGSASAVVPDAGNAAPGIAVGPNPTTDGAIELRLTRERSADLSVLLCDIRGERMATLFNGVLAPGSHALPFDLSGYPAGVYYLIVEEGSEQVVEKIELVR